VPSQTFAIASDVAQVPELCQGIRALLSSQRVDDADAIPIEICVAEAVNNVIEHGYRGDPNQTVEVVASVEPRRVVLEVRDHGPVFDPTSRRLSSLEPDLTDINALPERGRGLAIIREVMNEVSYLRRDDMNTLRMARDLPPHVESRDAT
jgi:serine/threonine-protein kinase RsbW